MPREPLISCILRGRPGTASASRAIDYFLRQEFGPRELILIDDSTEPGDFAAPDPGVRYLQLATRLGAAELRNFACREARGEIVVHWDEHAWYGPDYVLALADALLSRDADVAGPERVLFCEPNGSRAWEVRCRLGERLMFPAGCLAYRRAYWEANPFRSAPGGFDQPIPFERGRIVTVENVVAQVCFAPPPRSLPCATCDAGAIRRLLGRDRQFYWPAEGAVQTPAPSPAAPPPELPAEAPPVSCILLARDPRWVPVAADLFLRQDYEPRELIVVDAGAGVSEALPHDERIRCILAPAGISTGAARNLACQHARGEFIAHWDAGDWQAPHRLRTTVAALLRESADLAGPNPALYCDLESQQASLVEHPVEAGFWAAAGSLCYRRSLWEAHPFPDTDLHPDLRFALRAQSARCIALPDYACQVTFHRGAAPGRFQEPYRHPYPLAAVQAVLGEDWSLFETEIPLGVAAAAPPAPRVEEASRPLVSCIMPARGPWRRADLAIEYFLRQDYEPRELIILDDAAEPLGDLVPDDPRIRCLRLDQAMVPGAKLNLGCEQARGDIILHWYDDSWYAPERIRLMVQPLLGQEADLCGLNPLLLLDLPSGASALCRRRAGLGYRFHSSTLCYRRSLWQALRFPELSSGEEVAFLAKAPPSRVLAVSDPHCQVVTLAGAEEVVNVLAGAQCEPYAADELHRLLGDDWSFYEAALRPGTAPPPLFRPVPPPAELRPRPAWPPAPPPPAGPLVSCIMPTADRPVFLRRAIEYFLRQDYPFRELIIVDDGAEPVRSLLPPDPRIRYTRCDARMSLGAKRNLACEQARGEILAHWDDDDWQAPHRLSRQVELLEREQADLCGIGSLLVLDPRAGQAWSYRCPVFQGFWAAGSSFCYRRSLWERNRFVGVDLAEDRQFLWNNQTARMVELSDQALQVAILHGRNAAPLVTGGGYWSAYDVADVKRILGRDWQFYDVEVGGHAPAEFPPPTPLGAPAPRPPRVEAGARPLVSCIMPTSNRRRFVPLAIQYFLRQDYEPKELIIVDGGSDPIESLVPGDDRFLYVRLGGRMSLGAKRNLACTIARGDIILHWDDDDWQAPCRIQAMLDGLGREGAELCGLNPMYFFDIRSGLAWLYRYPPEQRFWVAGTSFCYRRAFWERNRFPDVDYGEDNHFIWNAPAGKMAALADTNLQVAILHDGNGSPKAVGDEYWQAHPASDIQWLLGPDWAFYRPQPPLTRLNLGCSDSYLPGMWNVDLVPPADQIVDLRYAWPWGDSSVEFILARDVIEHLPDKIHTMNQAWRVLRPGGQIEISLPTTEGSGAFQDPTHLSFWNRRSFLYFEVGSPYRERFAVSYGIEAAFRTISENTQQNVDGEYLTIVLEAVK